MLGHERVLNEGAGDPLRRVVEHRDGRVIGAAAFEPLYGPAAEVAVALEDPEDAALAARLVDDLSGQVLAAGLQTMRFALDAKQEAFARQVLGTEPEDGAITIRLSPVEDSVASTDGDAQGAPMARIRRVPIIDP